MFWKFTSACNINNLLDKADVTLQQIMDDDDVLQECKGQNTKLIEFLCKSEIIDQLVDLIISEPTGDLQEPVKYKYSNTACEILVSDVAQLNDALGDNDTLREKLFSFLDKDPPLNPLLASFFSKVVGILLSRKPEPTLDYIKVKEDFVGTVLSHLGTSAIMDLLLRLVTCVEAPNLRARVLSWLNENRLVERLIALINPAYSEDFHFNSSQALCDIIRLSREHMFTMQESAQEDPLLNTLEKQETVELLLQHMFDYGINESVTINGISVLLALLEIRRPAPFGFPEMAPELTPLDVQRLAHGVSRTLKGLGNRMENFIQLLANPPQKDLMKCTFGKLDPPLGNTRLHVVKLINAILLTNTPYINQQLSDLQVFNSLLDLFFRYEYNNFLHTQVVSCLSTILSHSTIPSDAYTVTGSEELTLQEHKEDDDVENPRKIAPLLVHIFEDCRLIQRILDAWNDNKIHEENCGQRKGYMGHLTIISNHITEVMDPTKNTDYMKIKVFVEGMAEEDQHRWSHFGSNSLREINEKNASNLGGHNPKQPHSDDDADDYNRFDSSGQQAFNDYQLQQITSNFSDQFGFNDSDYVESDDVDKFGKINQVDFDIKTDTDTESRLQFEKYCTSEIPTIDDHIDDEENGNDIFEQVDEDDEWSNTNAGTSIFENSNRNLLNTRPRCSSTDNGEANNDSLVINNSTAKQLEEMDTSAPSEGDVKEGESPKHQTTPHPSEIPWFDDEKFDDSSDLQQDSNNWANFDDFQSDKQQPADDKQSDDISSRASNYAVTDTSMADSTAATTTEAENSTKSAAATITGSSETMEVQQQAAASKPQLDNQQSSAGDVVMEDVSSKPVTNATEPPHVVAASSSSSSVAMEIDDCQQATNVASAPSAPAATADEKASSPEKPTAAKEPSSPSSTTSDVPQQQQKQPAVAVVGASEQVSLQPSSSVAVNKQQRTVDAAEIVKDEKGSVGSPVGKTKQESGNGEPAACNEAMSSSAPTQQQPANDAKKSSSPPSAPAAAPPASQTTSEDATAAKSKVVATDKKVEEQQQNEAQSKPAAAETSSETAAKV